MTNNMRVSLSHSAITLWLWLFPITYLIHIAEEYFVDGGYSAYLLKLRGVQLSTTRFLAAQSVGVVLMIVGIFVAQRFNFPQTLLVILGAVVLVNGITHAVTSVVKWGYGPGLYTSLFVWLPLGIVTLFQFYGRMSNQRFWLCGAIGLGINAAIAVFTMRGGRLI
jgi:uncharacterized protein with HXXEE motif